jgi:hypothetical protein
MQTGIFDLTVHERSMRLLLVDFMEHWTGHKLAEQLYSEHRNDLTVVDAILIRPPVDQPVQVPTNFKNELVAVFERAPKLSVHLLASNRFRIYVSENLHDGVADPFTPEEREALVPLLRQAELAEIAARRTHAVFSAEGRTWFRAPSKAYCKHFLRAGNVQMHRATLDTFFFWLLPWLENAHAVVSDSWTVSSILLNCGRLLSRYDPDHGRCKVDMLSRYHDGTISVEEATDEVLERVLHRCAGVVLGVFSACMTGRSVERLQATMNRHLQTGQHLKIVSLFNLEPGLPVETLCELHRVFPENAFRHYDQLPDGTPETHVVDIDRMTYFPSVMKEGVVRVDLANAAPAKDFFTRYAGSGAFFVHRDSYVSGQKIRHHAIFPDLAVLIEHPAFKDRFRAVLTALGSTPKIIVVPPHESGAKLAEFAATVFKETSGLRPEIVSHLDLNISRSTAAGDITICRRLKEIPETDSILVLDDVSVTGDRLTRFQKSLRDIDFKGQIHYLVGLARPQRQALWDRRVRDLRHRAVQPKHTVSYVEFLVLPDWDEKSCPWCAEQALYRKLIFDQESLPPSLARRAAQLDRRGADSSAAASIFLEEGDGQGFRLTDNSIFAPQNAGQAEVFVAAASTIQRLRVHDDLTKNIGRHHYPMLNCIDPEDYLGQTFRDPVLKAALLRAVAPGELERVKGEDEISRARMAKRWILSAAPDESVIGLEIAVAAALGKLPNLGFTAEEKEALKQRNVSPAIQTLLGLDL